MTDAAVVFKTDRTEIDSGGVGLMAESTIKLPSVRQFRNGRAGQVQRVSEPERVRATASARRRDARHDRTNRKGRAPHSPGGAGGPRDISDTQHQSPLPRRARRWRVV